jgi:hypothetical protein
LKTRARIYKGLTVCTMAVATGSGIFALSLLADAAWGQGGHVGNILIAGIGILSLFTSLTLVAVLGNYWKMSKISLETVPSRREE